MASKQKDKLLEELEMLEMVYKNLVQNANQTSLLSTIQQKEKISEVVTRMYTIRGRRSMKRTGDWLKEIVYGAQA